MIDNDLYVLSVAMNIKEYLPPALAILAMCIGIIFIAGFVIYDTLRFPKIAISLFIIGYVVLLAVPPKNTLYALFAVSYMDSMASRPVAANDELHKLVIENLKHALKNNTRNDQN